MGKGGTVGKKREIRGGKRMIRTKKRGNDTIRRRRRTVIKMVN